MNWVIRDCRFIISAISTLKKLINKSTLLSYKAKISGRIKLLKCLPPVGISTEKKVDFYDKIRVFVPEEFKNILCPKPTETERAIVAMARAKKRKTKQQKTQS